MGSSVPGAADLEIQAVGLIGRRPIVRKDLHCFGNPTVVVAGEDRAGTELVIAGYSPAALDALVGLMWNVVGSVRQTTKVHSATTTNP